MPHFYQKWWFTAIGIFLSGILIWIYIVLQIRRYKRKENEKNAINRKLNAYQLSALQAQMNPHFIFNAIYSIQQYVLTNQSESAYRYLTRFSQLIRKVLNQSNLENHSLDKELEIIDLYVQLEQLRFQNRFDYVLKIDPDLDLAEIKMPPFLLQPYVENAIWHGFMALDDSKKGLLQIKISNLEETIEIRIMDNGIGRKAASLKQSKDH